MVTSRNVSLLPLLLCAGLLYGCSAGSEDPEEDDEGDPLIVVVEPDEAVVPQGSSIVVRVDITGAGNQAVNGYEIELDEEQSKIDVRTAPCPANLARPACEDWTIAPAADSVPGNYSVRLRSVGLRGGTAYGSFSLRVVQSPVARHGAALDVVPVANSADSVLVLTDAGRIVSRGANRAAQAGQGYRQPPFGNDRNLMATPRYIPAFVEVSPGPDLGAPPVFTSVSLGNSAAYAASADGRAWHWGSRGEASSGEGVLISDFDTVLRLRPAPIAGPTGIRFVSTDDSSDAILATDTNGAVWSWGCRPDTNCEDADARPRLLDITGVSNAISTNLSGELFLMQDGRVLGSDRRTPVAGLPTPIVKLATNRLRTGAQEVYVALDASGAVWTWNARFSNLTPTRFAALTDATDVAVDYYDNLYALRRGSGSVWMWRLADPSRTREIVAPAPSSFIKVAPGYAILNDCRSDGGSLWRIQPPGRDTSLVPADPAEYVVDVLPEFGVGGALCPAVLPDVAPLTVSVRGNGRLVSEPTGIDCTSSSCTHEFRRGSLVILNAVADPGWRVVSVSPETCAEIPGESPSNRNTTIVRQVIAGQVPECTAVFVEGPPLEMRLTLEVARGGTVRSDPSGILCGGESEFCSRWFPLGAEVTLEPQVQSGYRFDGFGGDPDCADGEVVMTSGRLCHARFSQLTPSAPLPNTGEVLTVRMLGSGTVTGPEIDCPEDCTEEYPFNTVVTLEATPAPGWRLVRWIDGCDDDPDNRCIVRVVGTQTVVVEFSPIVPQSTLRVTLNGSGIGTVTSTPGRIVCSTGVCEAEFDTGDFVSLTATPAQGHFFAGWSGCDSPCEFTLDASREVTATFEPRPANGLFELEVAIEGPGRVVGGDIADPGSIVCSDETQPTNCSADFPVGSLIPMQASPTLNWLGSGRAATFIGWDGDSECDALGDDLEGLIPMNRNVRCIARFQAPNLHLVRFSVTGGGTVTNDPPLTPPLGLRCREGLFGGPCQANLGMFGTLPVRATPDFGMLFVGWGGDCASHGAARNATLVVNDNMNCTATFAQGTTPMTLTVDMQRGSPTRVITSEPEGISCFDGPGAVCEWDFDPGIVVILRSTLANTVWENCDEVFTVPIQFHECRMNMDQTDKFVLVVFPPL